MQISYKMREGEASIVLKYENREWDRLEEKFEDLGLKAADTEQGFGRGMSFDFYKTVKGKLMNFLVESGEVKENVNGIEVSIFQGSAYIFDDINSSAVIGKGYFNIAPFRVIPNRSGEVEIAVNRYLKSNEVYNYANILAKVYKCLDEASEPVEINVKIKDRPAREGRRERR